MKQLLNRTIYAICILLTCVLCVGCEHDELLEINEEISVIKIDGSIGLMPLGLEPTGLLYIDTSIKSNLIFKDTNIGIGDTKGSCGTTPLHIYRVEGKMF